MSESEANKNRKLAFTALLIDQQEKAPGLRPELDELWNWMQGDVSKDRAAEIEIHLARDPDVYEDWRQLRISVEELGAVEVDNNVGTQQTWQSLKSRFSRRVLSRPKTELSGLGIAVAAALVGVTLLIHQLGDNYGLSTGTGTGAATKPNFWQEWQTPKSNSSARLNPAQNQQLLTIQSGMQWQLKALSLATSYPDGQALRNEATDCNIVNTCDHNDAVLQKLGRMVVQSRVNCLDSSFATAIDSQTLLALTADVSALSNLEPISAAMEQWSLSSASTASHCTAVAQLISRIIRAR